MCHQSVGLIAREVESRGIPTLSMSSAQSITRAANPPRAVYLDYPLGHTAGRAEDPAEQLAIMRDTLHAFESIERPGTMIDLAYEWADDDAWKDRVMRPRTDAAPDAPSEHHADDRIQRFDTPQYQTEDDARLAPDPEHCPSCVFLDDVS